MRASLDITPRTIMKVRNCDGGRLTGRLVPKLDYRSAFGVALFGKRSREILMSRSPVDRARELPVIL